jgi:hypothetical protein
MTEIATYHRAKRNFGTGFQMIDRIEELEAQLAKAISAFEQIEAGVVPETDPDTGIWVECNMSEDEMQEIARTTLAELKGGENE